MDLQFFVDGKDRADQYSSEWSEESLQSAIEKFAKGSTPSYNNDKGKIIYKNTDSKYAVVYDYNGNYFRIEDTSIRSARRYTDINGNNVANKNDNGRIVGRSKDEYQAITHFKNKDVEVY
jgi:DNA modification methylase